MYIDVTKSVEPVVIGVVTVRLSADNILKLPDEVVAELSAKLGDIFELTVKNGILSVVPRPHLESDYAPTSGGEPIKLRDSITQKNRGLSMKFVKGVGPKFADLLEKLGVATIEDALFLLPIRYEDRRELVPVSSLTAGKSAVFTGMIQSAEVSVTKGGRRVYQVVINDRSGSVVCKWFNANAVWMNRIWKIGRTGIFCGDVSQFGFQVEVHHPEVEWIPDGGDVTALLLSDPANYCRIVPVYPLTDGIQQKAMRRIMREVVTSYLVNIDSVIPEMHIPMGLPQLRDAIAFVHSPPNDSILSDLNCGMTPAHKALAYDEFFFWELGLAMKKRGVSMEVGIPFSVAHRFTRELIRLLPFELTAAQKRVLAEIKMDMIAPHPMHRLVQGDVGSGKTLVALMASLIAVENDYQVAIMAPTEILAEQHWHTINRWCAMMGIRVTLITSALKGQAKKEALAHIADGTSQIVVGTHAVIQEKVEFSKLGLGVIDEQHRFGVVQRGILKKKGFNPDILVMTATPIPRTLAMTLFGDLNLSVIDELPPGRIPIETKVFFESRRSQLYDMVRMEIGKGRQVYVVYPLVEETEKTDLKAATQMAEHLQSDVFSGSRVGLLHGRLSPVEKESIMSAFISRDFDILVSTTVIEVGIDVPNASMIVIEHAERFGLSQLHQLRGRVGRGVHKSFCILMTSGKLSDDGAKRLKVMEHTSDGFKIAEADLEIRGPGDFLGTRQAGMPDFRVANILRDGALLDHARQEAEEVLKSDPELTLPRNACIHRELLSRWGKRLELATIG